MLYSTYSRCLFKKIQFLQAIEHVDKKSRSSMPIVAHLKRNLLIFPISVLFEAVLKGLLFISRDTRKEHETARARRSRVLVIKLAVKFHLQLRAFSKLLKVSLSFLSLSLYFLLPLLHFEFTNFFIFSFSCGSPKVLVLYGATPLVVPNMA